MPTAGTSYYPPGGLFKFPIEQPVDPTPDVWYYRYRQPVRRMVGVPQTPPICTLGWSDIFADVAANLSGAGAAVSPPWAMRQWGVSGGGIPIWYEVWSEWRKGSDIVWASIAGIISRDVAKYIGRTRTLNDIGSGLTADQLSRLKTPVYYDNGTVASIPSDFTIGLPYHGGWKPGGFVGTYEGGYGLVYPMAVGSYAMWSRCHVNNATTMHDPQFGKTTITRDGFLWALRYFCRLDILYSFYSQAGYDMADKFRKLYFDTLDKAQPLFDVINDAERQRVRELNRSLGLSYESEMPMIQPTLIDLRDVEDIAMDLFVEHLNANGSGHTEASNMTAWYYAVLDRFINQPSMLAIRRGRVVNVYTPAAIAAIAKGQEAAQKRWQITQKIKCGGMAFEMIFLKPLLFAVLGAFIAALPSFLEIFESAVDLGIADPILDSGSYLTGDIVTDTAFDGFEFGLLDEVPTDIAVGFADGAEIDFAQLDELFADVEGGSAGDLVNFDVPTDVLPLDEIAVDPDSLMFDPATGDFVPTPEALDIEVQPVTITDPATTELLPEAPPDVAPDVPPDIEPDLPPDIEPDLPPDIEPDLPPDIESDLPPDVEPDLTPDVEPDLTSDLQADAPPEIEDAALNEALDEAQSAADAGDIMTESTLSDGLSSNFPSLSPQQILKLAQQAYKLYQQLSAQQSPASAPPQPAAPVVSTTTPVVTLTTAPILPPTYTPPSPVVVPTYTAPLPVATSPGAVLPETGTPVDAALPTGGLSPFWLLLTVVTSMTGK